MREQNQEAIAKTFVMKRIGENILLKCILLHKNKVSFVSTC